MHDINRHKYKKSSMRGEEQQLMSFIWPKVDQVNHGTHKSHAIMSYRKPMKIQPSDGIITNCNTDFHNCLIIQR